jgi:hypothetical protein
MKAVFMEVDKMSLSEEERKASAISMSQVGKPARGEMPAQLPLSISVPARPSGKLVAGDRCDFAMAEKVLRRNGRYSSELRESGETHGT